MIGRILLTLDGLGLLFGAWAADYNSVSHIFNPRWPPHAKFHCGQTIGLSTALGAATLFLAWRPLLIEGTSREVANDSLRMAAFTGSVYWLSGLTAILFPGSMGLDPEFGGPAFPQAKAFLSMTAFGWAGVSLSLVGW